MIDGLILVLGLGLLIKGADLLVEGASSVASRFGISPLVIGLTVVSFGTSLPELLVSLTSGLRSPRFSPYPTDRFRLAFSAGRCNTYAKSGKMRLRS